MGDESHYSDVEDGDAGRNEIIIASSSREVRAKVAKVRATSTYTQCRGVEDQE